MTAKVISLRIPAGVQRDGTTFDAPCYTDGKWVRFQRGKPRKMGGYKAIFQNASGISRGLIMSSMNGLNYVTSGTNNGLQQWQTANGTGVGFGPTTYTMPGTFTSNANNLWQFDLGYDTSGGSTTNLVAHPGQNLSDISSTVNTPVFQAPLVGTVMTKVGLFTVTATATSGSTTLTLAQRYPLLAAANQDARVFVGMSVSGTGIAVGTTVSGITAGSLAITLSLATTAPITAGAVTMDNNISVSGGCCILNPYLFVYGNNGLIQNSEAGDFSYWNPSGSMANATNVAGSKIVKGMPLRGGSQSPAGLFWSLDSLIRVSFTGTAPYWKYDLLTCQTSIMSSSSIIEYDGIFYWAGVDRFMCYNGTVQEIPNEENMNYFFDNLNYAQRQKVWCTKVPRWGEIWWFYPHGQSTECNNALIYNIREKHWYDSSVNADGSCRSAGHFSEVFRNPIWADNTLNSAGTGYSLWEHETGLNRVNLSQETAIDSFIETNPIGYNTGGPGANAVVGDNNWIRLERFEPDFVQTGAMNLWVTGTSYADEADVTTGPYTWNPDTPKIDLREQRREMRLRFQSNVVGGDYLMGRCLLSADVGDVRGNGNP